MPTWPKAFQRSPMSIRYAVPPLSLIDWQNPCQDPLRFSDPGADQTASPTTGSWDSTSAERADAPTPTDASLRRQGAVFGARYLSGLLPVLYAQLRGQVDTPQVEKVHASRQ